MRTTKFRLRITDTLGNRTYIINDEKYGVSYISASETPLALSNLLGREAAETRFALEDAADAAAASKVLAKVLGIAGRGYVIEKLN
jgi:hypothetical protein